eukprot:Skav215521  [mRNA]  locus=scaffold2213:59790:65841:- [translate_table: standard]
MVISSPSLKNIQLGRFNTSIGSTSVPVGGRVSLGNVLRSARSFSREKEDAQTDLQQARSLVQQLEAKLAKQEEQVQVGLEDQRKAEAKISARSLMVNELDARAHDLHALLEKVTAAVPVWDRGIQPVKLEVPPVPNT